MMQAKVLISTVLSVVVGLVFAAGCASGPQLTATAGLNPPSVSKPEPDFLRRYAQTYRFRLGQPSAFSWTPDGQQLLFLRSPARSFVRDLYALDIKTGKERVLLTAEALLAGAQEALSAEEKARRERMRVATRGITSYRMSRDGRALLVPLSGRLFVFDRVTEAVRELPDEGGYPLDARWSPDGKKVACVRGDGLYIIDVAGGRQRRLTPQEGPGIQWGSSEFVAQEEMGRMRGYWWSPDSRHLLVHRTDRRGVETLHVADPMNPAKAPQKHAYPRAGTANARVSLHLVSVSKARAVELPWDTSTYPYLVSVRWSDRGAPLVVVQNRAQSASAIYRVELKSKALKLLHVARDAAWLNIDQSVPRWLKGGQEWLWISDDEGPLQLYAHDVKGAQRRALVPQALGFKGLVHVDDEADEVIVSASDDPTQRALYALSLAPDGPPPRRLTTSSGVHRGSFGRGTDYWVHRAESASTWPSWTLRDRDAKAVTTLSSKAEMPPFAPSLQFQVVGERDYQTVLIRPRDFDKRRIYPVILYVYGGPLTTVVWRKRSRYLMAQWLADHGFIVALADGRGTPGRGRAWERAIKGDFATIPLEDQIAALRALGSSYPEMDLERVGIYGWSYGGYMAALAVLRAPEVFHAAVSGAPVTDWAEYDTHYTERYLGGGPKDAAEAYQRSSLLKDAGALKAPLLLVHGTADDNVYFVHALKLSNALFRAGKTHEFLPLAGFTHMVPDPLVTERLYGRIADFFRENLGEPRTVDLGNAR